MRGIWAGSPALLLGLVAGGALADEPSMPAIVARTPNVRPADTSSVSPQQVIASSSMPASRGVSLGQPVANTPLTPVPAAIDTQLRPASFLGQPIVRAKGADAPQPLPVGQPLAQDSGAKGPGLLDMPADRNGAQPAAPPNAAPTSSIYSEGTFASDPWCGCGVSDCGGTPFVPAGLGIFDHDWPINCFWLRAEYLLWNISNSHLPALVTTSPQSSLGVLGNPGTTVLFGDSIHHDELSGGRFTLGFWFDPCQCFGLEANYFFIGQRAVSFDAASGGNMLLARPFFDISPPPGESAEQVANLAMPGVLPLAGRVNIHLSTLFQGAELNGLMNCWKGCWGRFDWITGFRYLRLHDTLDINEDLLVPPTSPIAVGQRTQVNDHFETRNDFYGGQIGFRTDWHWGRWNMDCTTKVALGTTHESLNIAGSTIVTPAGGTPSVFPGGLLAQPSNIGHFTRDRFAVVPEVGINIGYQLTDHWRVFAGYSFIYTSTVARPGEQIDRVVNSTLIPPANFASGPARPTVNMKDTDFWAHGVNIGLELKY